MTVMTKVKVSKEEDEPTHVHLVFNHSEEKMEKGVSILKRGFILALDSILSLVF